MDTPKRIAIIGNGGGGKSTLARRLARDLGLPVLHVDSVQFLPGLRRRPVHETRATLDAWAARPEWIIDGFGPMDAIERRFERADLVVFVDMPLWRHYLWAGKRQVQATWRTRPELPPGCSEAGLRRTWQLFRVMWRVHREVRPALLDLVGRAEIAPRVWWIRTPAEWRARARTWGCRADPRSADVGGTAVRRTRRRR